MIVARGAGVAERQVPGGPVEPERRQDETARALIDHVDLLFKRIRVRIALLGLVLLALGVLSLVLLSRQNETIGQVQHGRAIGTRVLCAAVSSVAQAGRDTIGSQPPPPPAMERALERLGFPSLAARQRQAQQQADQYVQAISNRIEEAVGTRGDGLVRANGTLDCRRLIKVVQAQ
jgi:hypothetical protein